MPESRESDAIIAIVDEAEIATEPLDLDCRKNMMLASLEVGFFSNTRLGAVHAGLNYAQL